MKKPQVVFHKRNELRQAMYSRNLELMSIKEEKLTKGTFRAPAGKNKFCFTDQSKDTEFIRYKSFLIDLKRNNI
jgi:RNA-directed DNA polymerase